MHKLFLKIFLLLVISQGTIIAKDYNASLFGIKSDGVTLNTQSIQKAIDFISEKGGGKLKFYVGRYLTGSVQLKSNVSIELNEGAVLVATTSVYDYLGAQGTKALIVAEGQKNIGVTGKGVIEGQGPAVLEQIAKQIQKGYLQETISQASPALIALNNCSGINIEGFNLQNACGNVIDLSACQQVSLSGLKIKSTSNKESKGLVFSKVEGIKLENLFIDTVESEIKSDGLSTNISMTNCQYASGKKLIFKN
jgi:polygalacturonase